ncbi:MAG TPA: arginine deiminase family protein, partial [Clostridia bacterium]|nr:arginine deiminase family protein [Clostridia bacterium]
MVDPKGVNVYSEIGRLKRVLLHCPGKELDNLTPINMKSLLFEDIPDSEAAAREHLFFAEVLRSVGTQVYYISELLAEVMREEEVRYRFLTEFLEEARVHSHACPAMFEYLNSMQDMSQLAEVLMSGLRSEDFSFNGSQLDQLDRKRTLLLDPMPNMYFTRDPMTVVGQGISINCMWAETRRRETLISYYIAKYHPLFEGVSHYYQRDENATLEGGDILVLSAQVIAVGVSQRTE